MKKKLLSIGVYCVPVIVMIGLIPFIQNDTMLAFVYCFFIFGLMATKREKHDVAALVFGIVAITASELFFVSTGVETFVRQSLFGLIPIWLPLLWGYAFVTIKRSLNILNS